MGYYDQRDEDGEYWVIPSQVDYRHGIKCPFCSKWNNPTCDSGSHESHKDDYWSCQHCNRPYQIYICSNCDEIAALPGKKGKGRRNCRCCRTKNLTTDWCFDDYSYSDDEESSDEEDEEDLYDQKMRQVMIEQEQPFSHILNILQNIELEYWKKSKGYPYNPTFANAYTGERESF